MDYYTFFSVEIKHFLVVPLCISKLQHFFDNVALREMAYVFVIYATQPVIIVKAYPGSLQISKLLAFNPITTDVPRSYRNQSII